MGRPAKNTEIEILQTILRLPVELGLNPGQIAVLAILAALGGGTFSRIKQNRGSMDECDEDTAQLQMIIQAARVPIIRVIHSKRSQRISSAELKR